MIRFSHLILALAAALALPGCAIMNAEVARFHHLPPKGSGETFAVIPPKGNQIENEGYSARIASHLEKYGWKRVPYEKAKYGVVFAYWLGDSHEASIPITGPVGGGTTYHSGSFTTRGGVSGTVSGTSYTPPTYGVVGMANVLSYDRHLRIEAFDRNKREIFNIRCDSTGGSPNMTKLMPHLIELSFAEFPGVSGSVRTHFRARSL